MKYPVLRCAVAFVLLLSASLADAAGSDYWYVGAGVGYGKIQFYPADFAASVVAPGTQETVKDADLGFTGVLGVQLNRNWAIELSYVQLGKFSYKYTQGTNTQETDYLVTGWAGSLLPTVPLTRNLSLFGRLGAMSVQTRTTITNPAAAGFDGSITPYQVNTVNFLSGFGGLYMINRDTGIRVEYQNLGQVGNAATGCSTCVGRANAQFLSATAILTF